MSSEMDCIVQDFLVESYENLDHLDQALIALEGDADPRDRLAGIFRAVHTIKGTCGFLGFSQLESLSHAGESLLSRLRDGELTPTPAITTALLQLIDRIREILAHIESTGQEGSVALADLVETLGRLQESSSFPEGDGLRDDVSPPLPETSSPPESSFDSGLQIGDAGEKPRSAGSLADTAIRVDVRLLDKLMVLVGELVLVRNRMQQHASGLNQPALVNSSQRLNWITTELQEAVMKARMQPIGSIWSKFPRVVRDLSLACGKQVSLHMEGLETELDKTLIEAIKDPFTHLLRNAIDHGIERPETRRARGKPPTGRIHLQAFHEGGQVNIDVSDDGQGISPEQIKRKGVERGVITAEQALELGDREAIQLIFLPGFSTAETITNVSGRGVGMDVVKANIERIGGTIDVTSRWQAGTTIRIKIPLTLAIIPALIVEGGVHRFAIPQVNLLELVWVAATDPDQRIEWVQDAPVFRLRGQLLPLLSLNRELRLDEPGDPAARDMHILVLQAEDRRFGLIVDAIHDSAEIVVKPLDKRLHAIRAFSGATILGDGRLALILDVVHLARSAGLVKDAGQAWLESQRRAGREARSEASASQPQTLLVFEADQGGRMAIPLTAVTRLEELLPEQLERVGDQLVTQYRGRILPLLPIRQVLGEPSVPLRHDLLRTAGRPVPVVVCGGDQPACGLIVDQILDIVEQDVEVLGKGARPGMDYTAVIQNRVTEVLDPAALPRLVASFPLGLTS